MLYRVISGACFIAFVGLITFAYSRIGNEWVFVIAAAYFLGYFRRGIKTLIDIEDAAEREKIDRETPWNLGFKQAEEDVKAGKVKYYSTSQWERSNYWKGYDAGVVHARKGKLPL